MSNKLTTIIILGIAILSFGIGLFFYSSLPQTVASHWNSQGMVDGYMSKFWGTFLTPIILLFMYGIYFIIPKIDPLKNNIASFRKQYNILIALISVFLFYIFILTLAWNLGKEFNMNNFILPAMGVFIFYMGHILKYAKRNWFVGIRTPWTLSSDYVWNRTHKIGGLLFKIIGIITLLGMLVPNYGFYLTIFSIIGSVIFLFVFSYILYQKQNN
ncbi:hypothetical protein A2996_01010 [Candidatus Campbellbacteria bacterium RIFCSPLOWO2_01_FULL_34_15]|uniref:DUF1648 domain-containing protein n=2 Tax=Candidatus Campbelliibacteriota TaxID=1752727 RepID=A0A1F5ENH7_9BACT|nr:MAG: hypothetical protein A2996_01010 [Candidatus Campbellbacteria bacterium RIFCSPLOWO2_01_FULL_34_15]OGD69630.1 MAG: hypothetical protein A2811_01980 [Candidatus Campbellbacteria bacterium RIFCSPHIGHO2_01_FULL_34_10]